MKLPAMLALVFCCSSFLQGADAPPAANKLPLKKRTFRLDLSLEDNAQGKIKVEFQGRSQRARTPRTGGGRASALTLEDLVPGKEEITVSDVPDGTYTVYFFSPGYANQFQQVKLDAQTKEPVELKAQLMRIRYAVIRYAYNASGGRELSGTNIVEWRAAVAHWGALPFFSLDWQMIQRGDGSNATRELFGDTLFLNFHRHVRGFGFLEAPKGIAFDQLKEAPASDKYRDENFKAAKGLTLFCRINGDRPEGRGYGKIIVEEITETPPAGIKISGGQ